MGKEIQLYSKDNKYMCFIELADSKDRFGCPDHSRIMLFEERNKKAYFIADARDKLLETEKDQRIAELEQELAELKKAIVPKFKVGKEIYFVIDKVEKGKIEKVFITISKNDDENIIFYSITDTYGYALRLPEEQVFTTEQEALEKLKEVQGDE